MSRRRTLAFAAPLVVTIALGGCDKKKEETAREEPPTRNPPEQPPPPPPPQVDASPQDLEIRYVGYMCLRGPQGKESTVTCPPELLPAAEEGAPVWEQYGECRTIGRRLVKCPANIVLPTPRNRKEGAVNVGIDESTLACQTWEDMSCPEGATCNPPPPQPAPCPEDLLPTLLPGTGPVKKKSAECFLGDVQVKCP